MPPPPLFIVAVNLYLIYVLFKKPRANPRTMYYEEQNTKLVFELEDGPLTKVSPASMPTPAPMPSAPAPAPAPAQSFVYNFLDKEQVPKVEVIKSVPEVVSNIILDTVVVNLEPVVVNLEPVVVNTSNNILETDPSIYAKYFTNFERIIAPQTRKNYTIVVHYENKTSSIPYSDYVSILPIYMNVVTLMNPK